jgi:hypothetical protein
VRIQTPTIADVLAERLQPTHPRPRLGRPSPEPQIAVPAGSPHQAGDGRRRRRDLVGDLRLSLAGALR